MAILVCIGFGLFLARLYYYNGLFPAAMTLCSALIAVAAGIGFGPVISDLLEFDSPYRHAATLCGVAIAAFGIVRVVLSPLDLEVDFPKWVENFGGAAGGLAAGLLLGGFLSTCLLSLDIGMLDKYTGNMRSASALAIQPTRQIARLIPGQYPIDLDSIVNGEAPEPPPRHVEEEGEIDGEM